jgi:hypothetical protein
MSMQNSCREGIGSTVKSLDCEFDGATQTRPAATTYQATIPKKRNILKKTMYK